MLQSISPSSTPCKSKVEGEVVSSRPTRGACATYEFKKRKKEKKKGEHYNLILQFQVYLQEGRHWLKGRCVHP